MTDSFSNKIRLTGSLILCALLTACSNNPLMQTSQATSMDAADAIGETLERSEDEARLASGADQPTLDLAEALLPPLQTASQSETFDVQAKALNAATFFQSLVAGTGYNVAIHPEISGSITLDLQQVTVPEAMEIVGDLYDFNIERQGRLFRVLPGGMQARIFAIDYLDFKRRGASDTRVSSGQVSNTRRSSDENSADADSTDGGAKALVGSQISTFTESDFWRDVRQAITLIVGSNSGRQVIVNAGAGLVMVRADSRELALVEQYLQKAQLIMQRQVILEARILEISLNEGYQQGIDWNSLDVLSGEINMGASLAGRNVSGGQNAGVFSASFSSQDFSSVISLLGTQGNVQILSSPRIATVNNQKAVIKVGTDEFFVTDIDFEDNDNALGADTGTSTSVQLTPFFSGISLDVTPQISDDGTITLHVHPAVSEVNDQEKVITIGRQDVTLPLALSTVRETDSVIRARSGQIVVIGGLIQNSAEDNVSSVPFLGDIPVLGELFKQRNYSGRKSELVILLKPVITGDGQMQQDIADSRRRMNLLRELLQSPDTVTPRPAGPERR